MFFNRRKIIDAEPIFPTTFEELGYQVNASGQVWEGGKTDAYPPVRLAKNKEQRYNELYTEALLESLRNHIIAALTADGVKEYRLTGKELWPDDGLDPSTPHVTIFCSDLQALKHKDSVVVVCGQQDNDALIWTLRGCLDHRGINASSVLGLSSMLHNGSRQSQQADTGESNADEEVRSLINPSTADQRPGLIIFNPGQIYHSPSQGRTYTRKSWLARPRSGRQTLPYEIHEQNLVDGHRNAQEHVSTVVSMLPGLISPGTKIRILAIADGAKHVLKAIDDVFMSDSEQTLKNQLAKTILIEPTHDDSDIGSAILKAHLAHDGVSWVLGNEPKGTLVGKPAMLFSAFEGRLGTAVSCPTMSVGEGVHFVDGILPVIMADVRSAIVEKGIDTA